MKKHILPLIFASMCLIATPVYAADPVDAIVPVSCTADGSTESFTVSIQGDSGFKASPEKLELKDGESKNFTISINLPGDYKYKIYQEKGTEKNTEYDSNVYQAEVFVTEDENGRLNADTVVFTNGSNEKSPKCEFVNKVKNNAQIPSNPESNSSNRVVNGNSRDDGGGVGATSKSTSSATGKVRTGVDTFEGLYAGIGLTGMIVAVLALKKRRKQK